MGAIKSVVGPDLAVANSGIRQCLKAAALRLESHVFRELWEGDMTLVMERVHQVRARQVTGSNPSGCRWQVRVWC